MRRAFRYQDSFKRASKHELISISVLCRPTWPATIEDFETKLSLRTLEQYLPTKGTLKRVAGILEKHGFEVFHIPSPIVSARATVEVFQSFFGLKVEKRLRRITRPDFQYTIASIVAGRRSAEIIVPTVLQGLVLQIGIEQRPLFMTPKIPPPQSRSDGVDLHVPGDIAQLTRASATHRLTTPSGTMATGAGVAVAVIDTGFAKHPYYKDHGYNIVRLAAPDTTDPTDDVDSHGTGILANLLACAPDVQAYAVKHGDDSSLAIAYAMQQIPQPSVISLSWADPVPAGQTTLPTNLIKKRVAILNAIRMGATVVAASGNSQLSFPGQMAFPGMMPEVISVGGVAVAPDDSLSRWPDSTNFVCTVYPGRSVPDLSGIASAIWLPCPPDNPGDPFNWDDSDGGTSSATPQVAGVCALLLQKDPSLTPLQVRSTLMQTAKTVGPGTGKGLVNAHRAWKRV